MSIASEPKRCPQCGGPIPAEAPQGLCPKCLLLQASAPTEAGRSAPGRPAPPALAELAAAFPQLEILELIGQGGMGFVFKARQPRLDRFVALKILPQSLASDPAFAERFTREGRVLARLNHPNIVTIHDFGQADGFFYLVMEFVDGVNLRQAMKAGRFTPAQALAIVPKICEALQFAHSEGILHRDIKPENILLDAKGRVKIADFGIAKLVGTDSMSRFGVPPSDGPDRVKAGLRTEAAALTETGRVLGTPHYMAPEQLEKPAEVDHRADIYSLGVVFYEMLTGELPIGRFAPPSEKSGADPRVDDVVLRTLEKERERRPQSAGEVKTRVETIALSSAASGPLAPGDLSGSPLRSICYLSTPERMRHCFPSAAAQIFICKGELRLDAQTLTMLTPWQTSVVIPLKDIENLGIGQFQMWTTPWVMRYARVNFLRLTFITHGRRQTLHLTPVPAGVDSAQQINEHLRGWFDAVQKAATACAGAVPRTSAPGTISISAQPAWNRKGVPLLIAFLATLGLAFFGFQSGAGPAHASLTVPVSVTLGLLVAAMGWFLFGFLKANSAIWRGDLDAVTSDEPPAGFLTGSEVPGAGEPPVVDSGISPRLSRAAVVGACLAAGFFIASFGCYLAANVVVSPPVPGMRAVLLLLPIGLLAIAAPLAATLLGWISVSQIRHSGGRLYGIGLAVLDGLLFPLLALDALIFIAFRFLGAGIISGFGLPRQAPLNLLLVLMVLFIVFVDGWIVRAIWRAVNRPVAVRGAEQRPATSFRAWWLVVPVAALLLVFVLAPALFLALSIPTNQRARPQAQGMAVAANKLEADPFSKTIVLTRAANQMVGTSNDSPIVTVWTDSTVLPGEMLRAMVRLPDGRIENAGSSLHVNWSPDKVGTSSSFTWFFQGGFGAEEAEAVAAHIRQSQSERPLRLTADKPLQLFSATNRHGGELAGYVEYERADPQPPKPGARVQASVRIHRYAAYVRSLDYSAEVPPGYSLRATANSGQVSTHSPAGPYAYHSTWFRIPGFNPPSRTGSVPPRPEELRSQQLALEDQFQQLQDQGAFPVVLGEPRLLFSITNAPGDVYQGFLELVGPPPKTVP